ncbi:hypothetical protein BT69DRAFT_1346683 [Atractiella rhizophila]|nr:hypothetical protein BT69DRAFT_1346683 [Atractiella rhizophila]
MSTCHRGQSTSRSRWCLSEGLSGWSEHLPPDGRIKTVSLGMEDDKSKHRDFAPLIEFSDSYTESPSSNDLTETILPHRTLPRLSSSSSESIAPPASSPSTPASAASVAPPFPTPADAGEDPFRFSTSNIQKQSLTIAASANVTEMTEQQKHQSDALASPQLQTAHKRTDSVGTVRENDAGLSLPMAGNSFATPLFFIPQDL